MEAEGHHEGAAAVGLGWHWIALFVFDVPARHVLFRLFLEAPS